MNQGMQGAEIAGVVALIVIAVLLARRLIASLRRTSPEAFLVIAAAAAALIGAVGVRVMRGDFFPDGLEPVARIGLALAIVVGSALLAVRELF